MVFYGEVKSMICSDIWYKYHERYFQSVIRIFTSRQASQINFLRQFEITGTNHAIIWLYYYPQRFCNFHIKVFQIKLKCHCSKSIKLQNFLVQQQYKHSNRRLRVDMTYLNKPPTRHKSDCNLVRPTLCADNLQLYFHCRNNLHCPAKLDRFQNQNVHGAEH